MRRHNPDADSEALQFGSLEVCQLAGVTLRQLQWWDERRIVSPRQQGHRRLYVVPDVIAMMVIGELRRKGLSLQRVRRLVPPVRREDQAARIIERLKNSRKPLAVVSISAMGKRLAGFQQPGRSREAEVRGNVS